jgi:hypothetical protein
MSLVDSPTPDNLPPGQYSWSTPVNLGGNVNTLGNETRASLSGDGHRLHFGRDGDVYVSERSTVPAGS